MRKTVEGARRLSMAIGPTRFAPSVLDAAAEQPAPLGDPRFVRTFGTCLETLSEIVGAEDGECVVVPATGTMGLEMAAASVLRPGDAVVVVSTGSWGDRWARICTRLGLDVTLLDCPAGCAPDADAIATALVRSRARALLATHVDSSSGVRLPPDALAAFAHRTGALVLIDGICAAGAEEVRQTAWGVDVYVASSPKALGAPAGLAVLSLSERVCRLLRARTWTPCSFSLDLASWLDAMRSLRNGRFLYVQTPASNLVSALAKSCVLILAEGVRERAARHRRLAAVLREQLDRLGLRNIVRDPALRAGGVTVCAYPEGSGAEFVDAVAREGVDLPSGTHPAAGATTFRIGHLGNVTLDDITTTIAALDRAVATRRTAAVAR